MPTEDLKTKVTEFRDSIATLVASTAQLKEEVFAGDQLDGQNKDEMLANLMISLRALEDASMRFGKVMQAATGGVSPLGGSDTPGTEVQGTSAGQATQ